MRTRTLLLLTLTLLFSVQPLHAESQSVDRCKIAVSSEHQVSLGFPIYGARLANIPNPKILVIPFNLKGEDYKFDLAEKNIFLETKKNIYEFSNGKSVIEFTFNNVVDIASTAKDMTLVKPPHMSKKETWQERYAESTWGFVSRFISEQDSKIDYSDFDAIILISKSFSNMSNNGEAMMMFKDYGNPWFNPMDTKEGPISNVAFIYNNSSAYVVTHELMHLYGLTDLYGSQNGVPSSLMLGNVIDLLAWEKWVLGWLEDQNVQCMAERFEDEKQLLDKIYDFDYSISDQLLVIPTGEMKALIVDLVKRKNRSWISFYSIDNGARPPIAAFPSSKFEFSTEITQKQGIGTLIKSPNYSLLISDNDGQKLSFVLIPTSLINSDVALKLIANADLKEKQFAEAKAKETVSQKTTITCVKGKSIKKITAVKPKCTSGYKVKK